MKDYKSLQIEHDVEKQIITITAIMWDGFMMKFSTDEKGFLMGIKELTRWDFKKHYEINK